MSNYKIENVITESIPMLNFLKENRSDHPNSFSPYRKKNSPKYRNNKNVTIDPNQY